MKIAGAEDRTLSKALDLHCLTWVCPELSPEYSWYKKTQLYRKAEAKE